jgi:hypothetical protein
MISKKREKAQKLRFYPHPFNQESTTYGPQQRKIPSEFVVLSNSPKIMCIYKQTFLRQ